jgi:hypothetical protein
MMRLTRCGLALFASLLAAPLLAQAPGDDPDQPAVVQAAADETADADQTGGGGGKKKEEAFVLLLLLAVVLPAAMVAVLTVRTALSLGIAALWPGATERGREQMVARPWLALGWGTFLTLFLIGVFSVLQNLGDAAGLLVVLLLLATIAAAAFGSTCLCEWLGGRLYELMPAREPTRWGRLVVGSIVLPLMIVTPPGWLAAPFVFALALGAFRMALGGHR